MVVCSDCVLCGGVARQTGQETQFCSQLVLASIMIGRLCKVLWPCAVRRREATEGERGRRGSLTGRPLRNAINSCSRRQGELGVSGRTLFSLSRLSLSLSPARRLQRRISKRSKAHGTSPAPAKPTLAASHNLAGTVVMTRHPCSCRSLRERHSKGPGVPMLCAAWEQDLFLSCLPQGQGCSLSSTVHGGLDRWAGCDLSAATL